MSDFTMKAAAYTARYIMEKVNGPEAVGYYQRVDPETGEVHELVPEYNRCSLGRGIGADYVRLYFGDLLQSGTCVVDGVEVAPPRFYDRMMKRLQGMEEVKYKRYLTAKRHALDSRPDRLAARARVVEARLKFKKRHTEVL